MSDCLGTTSGFFGDFKNSDPNSPKCFMCGKKMFPAGSDPQQGKNYTCSCGASSLTLPDNPPCGCTSQPCEHTDWAHFQPELRESIKKMEKKKRTPIFSMCWSLIKYHITSNLFRRKNVKSK